MAVVAILALAFAATGGISFGTVNDLREVLKIALNRWLGFIARRGKLVVKFKSEFLVASC